MFLGDVNVNVNVVGNNQQHFQDFLDVKFEVVGQIKVKSKQKTLLYHIQYINYKYFKVETDKGQVENWLFVVNFLDERQWKSISVY